jgi:hypothetical protein
MGVEPTNNRPDRSCAIYFRVGDRLRQRGDPTADFFARMGILCKAYQNDEGRYTSGGQIALRKIRPILANGLLLDMQMNPSKSGSQLRENWILNHPAVYREAGVFSSEVSGDDRERILSMAWPTLLSDLRFGLYSGLGFLSMADPIHGQGIPAKLGLIFPSAGIAGFAVRESSGLTSNGVSSPYRAASALYGPK